MTLLRAAVVDHPLLRSLHDEPAVIIDRIRPSARVDDDALLGMRRRSHRGVCYLRDRSVLVTKRELHIVVREVAMVAGFVPKIGIPVPKA